MRHCGAGVDENWYGPIFGSFSSSIRESCNQISMAERTRCASGRCLVGLEGRAEL